MPPAPTTARSSYGPSVAPDGSGLDVADEPERRLEERVGAGL